MALLEIGNDLLPLVYDHFHKDKRGAVRVWRLVCKAMRDLALKTQPSWLRAMGVSVSLVDFFCAMVVREDATYFSTTVLVHGVHKKAYYDEFLIAIAKGGNPNVMLEISNRKWAKETGFLVAGGPSDKLVHAAAKAGDLDMLTLLLALGLKVGKSAFAGAASGGHVQVLNFLLDMRQLTYGSLVYPPDQFTFYQKQLERMHTVSLKAQFDSFHCLRFLVTPAIKGGNLDIVKRIAHEIAPFYQRTQEANYNDEFFRGVAERAICDKQDHILAFAADCMSVEAFAESCDDFTDLASECASLPILKYLLGRAGNAFCDEVAYASWDGNVAVFKWLVEKVTMNVTAYSYLTVLLLPDTDASLELLDYLFTIKCAQTPPSHDNDFDLYNSVTTHFRGLDALKRIEWLYAHGLELKNGILVIEASIKKDDLTVVQRLHEMSGVLTTECIASFKNQEYWQGESQVAQWFDRMHRPHFA